MRKIGGRFGAVAVVTGLMGMMLAAAMAAPAQNEVPFTSLHSFGSGDAEPYAGLLQASDGSLYGTSAGGTVFKISPQGAFTTLYGFCSQKACADGGAPAAGLIEATDGDFYGTTTGGGNYSPPCDSGCGTVFKISPAGTLTTLHSFDYTDGEGPHAGLIQATDGNFYGTTIFGGAYGEGTVFRMTPSGALTTLYNFCPHTGCADGASPYGTLVQSTDGNFYGTTSVGGIRGWGTVFKITPSGVLTTLQRLVYADGAYPYAGLIQATDGNFYGTAYAFGANGGGTIFKMTPEGILTVLYSFDDFDGGEPWAGLVQGSDGNFYGTSTLGGANGRGGTVFKITPSGMLTTLHNFDETDGDAPSAPLLQDTNGNFYGTTIGGGTSGDGTVFGLSAGLGPFLETRPTSGKVGTAVRILGAHLEGSTTVTFNGTAATFMVISGSLISTTVPTGATTGPVHVVTPSGTLTSNVNFRVQ